MMNHIFPFETKISYLQRKTMMKQNPLLIWITGLSGSGKTTLALRLEHYLYHHGFKAYLLDGDNIRNGLNSDLGFTEEDRKENIRRIGGVAGLMLDAGLIVISAFISPYESQRASIKKAVSPDRYVEIFVNCPLEICEERDVKGLYQKARQGNIPNFTGISAPYENPSAPDLEVRTNEESIDESLSRIVNLILPLIAL